MITPPANSGLKGIRSLRSAEPDGRADAIFIDCNETCSCGLTVP
jgi:hypothetical protein